MNSDLEALKHNKTWIFVNPPPHVKHIESKWVYKVKHKVDGMRSWQIFLLLKATNNQIMTVLFSLFIQIHISLPC